MPKRIERIDKRVLYFDEQTLKAKDHTDEQTYHINRQRSHNQWLHCAGVCEGLNVSIDKKNSKLKISPGTALDLQGRLIVLSKSHAEDLNKAAGPLKVFISYNKEQSDPGDGDNINHNMRCYELPQIEVVTTPPAGKDPILLATVDLAAGKVDNTVRRYAGLRLPGAGKPENQATLCSAAQGGAEFSGDLSITGDLKVGAGSPKPSAALDVNGTVNATKFTGDGSDLKVGNGLSVKEALNQKAALDGSPDQEFQAKDLTMAGALFYDSTTITRQMINLWKESYGIGVQKSTQYFRTAKNFAWYKGGSHDSDELKAGGGGTVQMVIDKDGNVGINADKPLAKLDVVGNAKFAKEVQAEKFTGDGSELQVGKECITAVLAQKVDSAILRGMITMWSGDPNKLPAGWVLCDGRKVKGITTPNLRGRFIVGYDPENAAYNQTKKTGGEWIHKLTLNEMPSHSHTGTTDQDSSHTILDVGGGWGSAYCLAAVRKSGIFRIPNKHQHNLQIQAAGSGKPHENRPPYLVLAYIMYVGE